MTDKTLFQSTALIIDDEVLKSKTSAFELRNILEKEGCLFVVSTQIIDDNAIDSLSGISFIILDWKLEEKGVADMPDDIQLGSAFWNHNAKKAQNFVLNILGKYFIPIFIFSQEDSSKITNTLEKDSTIKKAIADGRVIIDSKNNLTGEKIKTYLFNWFEKNSTTYGLKLFEQRLNKAKNDFFIEVGNYSDKWLGTVFSLLKKEHVPTTDADDCENSDYLQSINRSLTEFIISSFLGRLDYVNFNNLNFSDNQPADDIVISIFSSVKFYKYENSVGSDQVYEGDIYQKISVDGKFHDEYLVSITAPCDLRHRRLLMLKGVIPDYKNYINSDNELKKKESSNYIPLLLNKNWVEFPFNTFFRTDALSSFEILSVKEEAIQVTYKRIGRLVHPYITDLRTSFSNYISRQGIHRHPKQIFSKEFKTFSRFKF